MEQHTIKLYRQRRRAWVRYDSLRQARLVELNAGPKERVLVLGFYDRKNLGDDAYKLAIPRLLATAPGQLDITFASMDDIQEVPQETDVVICGGGDIINDYFMSKATRLLRSFAGRVYALSVGIPYTSGSKYLHLFDHVFTRSQSDYRVAVQEVGEKNVTYCADAALVLPLTESSGSNSQPTSYSSPPAKTQRIGVCLAHPAFHNNPNGSKILSDIADVFWSVHTHLCPSGGAHFYLLAFNQNTASLHECDYPTNQTLKALLDARDVPCTVRHDVDTPLTMLEFIDQNIDLNVCMRYHSVIFSTLAKTPFVACYTSPKVGNVLLDLLPPDSPSIVALPKDCEDRPTGVPSERLLDAILKLQGAASTATLPPKAMFDVPAKIMFEERRLANVPVERKHVQLGDIVESCKLYLSKYLNVEDMNGLLERTGPLPIPVDKTPLNVARFICYLISHKASHSCAWGLAENMSRLDFNLLDAIKYIWQKNEQAIDDSSGSATKDYYPQVPGIARTAFVNVDFAFSNDFSQYHRSGWTHVIGGLMNMDASSLLRDSDTFVDTYVDRSFHWGSDILESTGVIPYTRTWFGFVHHTFDTSHSEYNCTALFENKMFLESLKHCQGLIALSDFLASQLRTAISATSTPDVPVFSLPHPMEFVETVFTPGQFRANPNKAVVHIGAWMRKPYSFYELYLPEDSPLHKVALNGTEMDLYFPPPSFMDVMEDVMLNSPWHGGGNPATTTQPQTQTQTTTTQTTTTQTTTTTTTSGGNTICRSLSSNASSNKFCEGLYKMLVRQHSSVEVLTKLDNSAYDKLLTENIVFLDLIDCSAVNTVIECIVRNTPLIVNRHPALEELLGPFYPGFYKSIPEASLMCQDFSLVVAIYTYLTNLDKSRYTLQSFMQGFLSIVTKQAVVRSSNISAQPLFLPRAKALANTYTSERDYILHYKM